MYMLTPLLFFPWEFYLFFFTPSVNSKVPHSTRVESERRYKGKLNAATKSAVLRNSNVSLSGTIDRVKMGSLGIS